MAAVDKLWFVGLFCFNCAADATDRRHLFDSWCRSPTAYFLLVEKVGKAPLKPLWFQPSRLKKSIIFLSVIGTPARKQVSFAPLARYSVVDDSFLPFLRCALLLLPFSGACAQIRHSETKAQTAKNTAGAGERGK